MHFSVFSFILHVLLRTGPKKGRPRKGGPQRPIEEDIRPTKARRPSEAPRNQPWPEQLPDERISPRRAPRPERRVRDDPDPIEESIRPRRATDRENHFIPDWPGEVPDENLSPRRAPRQFAPERNAWPEDFPDHSERPKRAPKVFVDEFDSYREIPIEEDYPQTSPERLISTETEPLPEQNIPVRIGDSL